MRTIFIAFLFSLVCTPAFAAATSSPMTSGFLGVAELTGGAGTSGSQTSLDSRNMVYGELALRFGYRFGMIAPVLEGTYRSLGQTTAASSVGNTNMAGSGYLLGAGLNFHFSMFSLTAAYDFAGEFTLSKQTSSGSTMSYTSPGGYRVALGFPVSHAWDLILSYSYISYQKSKIDSTEASLTDDQVRQTTYGLGVAYEF